MSFSRVLTTAVLFIALFIPAPAFSDEVKIADKERCRDNGIDSPSVAQDFLAVNSYCKNIRYVPVVKIWTDIDQKYIKDALARAVHKSVGAALSSSENEGTAAGGLMEKFQQEMKAAAFDELIKTPRVYKLVNKLIQVDIYFIPQLDSPAHFDNELASNMLIRVNDTNSLASKMAAEDNPVEWSRLQETFDRIISLSDEKDYIYLGGVATASLKLVDLDWNPAVIPDTDNIVKGFLRFRRWYAATDFDSAEEREGQDTNVYRIRFGEAGSRTFVTSDVSYRFNLGNATPSLHSMEVHFGNLLDGHGRELSTRNSLDMPTTIPIIGEIVPMSERGMIETERPLLVEGETKGFLSGSFSREIYSLAWSFETQGVDADRTQANWSLLSYTYFAELMEEHGRDIADVLGLRRFYDLDARSRNLIGLQENKPQDAAIDSEHGGKEGDQR